MTAAAAVLVALAVAAAPPAGTGGAGHGVPAPVRAGAEIPGRVLLDGFASRVGMPAVVFDHWSHRPLYTCRVCHVDLGFAMRAGETPISAAGNEDGRHCGGCHDGRTLHDGRPVFAACRGWPRLDPARGCERCHRGAGPGRSAEYEELRRRLPADVAGDPDWSAAARRGLIRPADVIPGSPRRAPMRIDRDVEIPSRGTWMNDVTFSHRRHVGWVACELCHPDVFPVGRRGTVRYRMEDMRAGRHCGACHLSVAFPLSTCQRCHGRPAR